MECFCYSKTQFYLRKKVYGCVYVSKRVRRREKETLSIEEDDVENGYIIITESSIHQYHRKT